MWQQKPIPMVGNTAGGDVPAQKSLLEIPWAGRAGWAGPPGHQVKFKFRIQGRLAKTAGE